MRFLRSIGISVQAHCFQDMASQSSCCEITGSQPRIGNAIGIHWPELFRHLPRDLQNWWPGSGRCQLPPRYLYRAMTVGLQELKDVEHRARNVERYSEDFANEVFEAVAYGSNIGHTSFALHTSLDRSRAQRWHILGRENRNEREEDQKLVRIDIGQMLFDKKLNKDMVDM